MSASDTLPWFTSLYPPCSLSGTCSTPLCWDLRRPRGVCRGGRCCGWPELTGESARWTGVDSRPALTDRQTHRPNINLFYTAGSYLSSNRYFLYLCHSGGIYWQLNMFIYKISYIFVSVKFHVSWNTDPSLVPTVSHTVITHKELRYQKNHRSINELNTC